MPRTPSKLAQALNAEDPEKEELRKALRTTQRQLARKNALVADLIEAVYRGAYDAALAVGKAKIPPRPARDRRKRSGEVALIHTTDWQWGKVTSSYSSEVARKRLTEQFTNKIERLTEIQRSDHPVRIAHYMVGGDMVEGVTIFPGQAFGIDATLYDQLFDSADGLETMLLHGLGVFDEIHVWEEKGNHGRLGKKGEMPAQDNVDLMMYRIVRERFRGDSRVHWHPLPHSGAIANHVQIGAYSALLFHGDEIKSFGGNTPAFGILRKVTKWQAGGYQWPFKDAYGGHFHTPMSLTLPAGGRIFMTGSPESDNEFAQEFMAETGEPSQRLHFIDPVRGRVTAEYNVFFEDAA